MTKVKFHENIQANQLVQLFSGLIKNTIGNTSVFTSSIVSSSENIEGTLIWLNETDFNKILNNHQSIKASIIIADKDFGFKNLSNQCVFITNKPRLLFASILNFIKSHNTHSQVKIHQSAFISSNAVVGNNVRIGPFVYIGSNVVLGDNTIIEGHVHIYDDVSIGHNVIIQAGSAIGTEVMSFTSDLDGEYLRFPTFGSVLISDNVEIGANVTIVKSSLDKTIIGKGTKINSNSYIGSSVIIGKKNYIASGVMINGSVTMGNSNFIGSGSVIRNKTNLGDNNTVGAGAVVVKNIHDNITLVGNPAIENKKLKNLKL